MRVYILEQCSTKINEAIGGTAIKQKIKFTTSLTAHREFQERLKGKNEATRRDSKRKRRGVVDSEWKTFARGVQSDGILGGTTLKLPRAEATA